MLKKYFRFAAIATLAAAMTLLAGGCSQKTVKTGEEDSAKSAQSAQEADGKMASTPGSEESLDTPSADSGSRFSILEGRSTGPMLPIYFDFDQSNVRADQKGRIEKNATYLKTNNTAQIVVEGNCDERGTNEYNMALGERRALSAKKYLENLGVASGRINTISYGEEKPLNHGHDELAWSQNRRADFVQTR